MGIKSPMFENGVLTFKEYAIVEVRFRA